MTATRQAAGAAAAGGTARATGGLARLDDSRTAHVAYLVIIKKNGKIGGGLSGSPSALEIVVAHQTVQFKATGRRWRRAGAAMAGTAGRAKAR